ncbi:hypothetical protein E2F46_02015 [Luteimonas aestuarii]|uniref:Uncharacterized protein n=1 Tax=Luteimonas aestuarii TaxID=453837 RepID=A0A4R5U4K5_9GAMM|nr:hypothetical protein [Luteimonas aestuarii]TDK28666.1 hypothetical protein E2F46_02015 [Luteimonas aestuarii]
MLTTASTWFFEGMFFKHPGNLAVRLAEGIVSDQTEAVDVDGTELGPYRPVLLTHRSRVVEIVFDHVWRYEVTREGRERAPEGRRLGVSDFLYELPDDEFDQLFDTPMMQADRESFGVRRWFLWTEDFALYVAGRSEPTVCLTRDAPDLSVERGATYFA